MAEGAGGAEGEPSYPSEQAVIAKYNQLRNELNQLFSKYTELEMEMNEHELVIKAIEPMDAGRRCYRLIGGVLVERTVGEVLPAVRRNRSGLQDVVERLQVALQNKKQEITDFEARFKIRVRKADEVEAASKGMPNQGVLVAGSS